METSVVADAIDGYRNCVSNVDLVLGKPSRKQSRVENNTYTLLWDVGTFNIKCNVIRLVLVSRAGSGIADIGNWIVISET
jgi:hypothetical protein